MSHIQKFSESNDQLNIVSPISNMNNQYIRPKYGKFERIESPENNNSPLSNKNK